MHICYIVTVDPVDTSYADLAYISLLSLRIVHPDAHVTILLGPCDLELLQAMHHPLLEHVQVRAVETGQDSMMQRSRWLKTSARLHLPGDFLMLDSDTLIIRPLASLFQMPRDVTAAIDNNFPPNRVQLAPWVAEVYAKLNWTYDAPRYYNSGVVFYRDTPAAHAFSASWHAAWQQSCAIVCAKDQPAFNAVVPSYASHIGILPMRYNAMIAEHVHAIRDAAVLHFWVASKNRAYLFVLMALLEGYRQTGQVDMQLLHQTIRSGYAWTDPYYIKAQWHSGHAIKALQALGVKTMRRLNRLITAVHQVQATPAGK